MAYLCPVHKEDLESLLAFNDPGEYRGISNSAVAGLGHQAGPSMPSAPKRHAELGNGDYILCPRCGPLRDIHFTAEVTLATKWATVGNRNGAVCLSDGDPVRSCGVTIICTLCYGRWPLEDGVSVHEEIGR